MALVALTMTIFDSEAIEQALIAFGHWDAEKMREAFSAAEASMRERGLMFDDTMNFWAPDDDKNALKLEHDLPVTIIRKETP